MSERDPMHELFEQSDAQARPLVIFTIGLTVLIAVSFLVAASMASSFGDERESKTRQHPLREYQDKPSAPLLQAHPMREIGEHRVIERERLSQYGWIDETADVVRIPVEAAMRLTVERGLPVREEGR